MRADDLESLSANGILAALPAGELRRLAQDGDLHEMERGDVVQEIGDPLARVVFPLGCLVSMTVELADGTRVESTTIGREGFAGLPVFFGAHTATLRAEVKVAGRALIVEGDEFRRQLEQSSRLCNLLGRYTELLFLEAAQVNACSRAHTVAERCMRWLLTATDQIGTETITTSQAALAQELGIRRASVTRALNGLEQAGLISVRRGRLAVSDRPGLRAAACECYAAISEQYQRTAW